MAAHTGKGELTAGDFAAGSGCRRLIQFLRDPDLMQIQHPSAVGTDVMDMWGGISVESLHAFHCAETYDDSLLFKQRQIPVYRT